MKKIRVIAKTDCIQKRILGCYLKPLFLFGEWAALSYLIAAGKIFHFFRANLRGICYDTNRTNVWRTMRMGEYLPGELQDRLRELRDARGIKSQDKLADLVGVTRSTYGRVENGQTKTISSDMLIKLAKFYNVPTDYILGLSDTPENTGYDIKELGLSVEAAKNLYTKKVDPNVASLLLANDKFAGVTKLIATYFSGSMASMMVLQNNLLDFSYGIIEGHVKAGELPNDSLIRETKRNLKAAKLPGSQIELDRIQRQFMAAVKEIKEQAFSEVPLFRQMPETLRFEIMDKIRSEIMSVPKPNELPEAERIALTKEAILKGFSLDPTVDEEQMEMFGAALDQIIPVMFKKWDRKKKKETRNGRTSATGNCASGYRMVTGRRPKN